MKYVLGIKVSKSCKATYREEEGVVYWTITGSPSDIRKMVRMVEAGGRTPWYTNRAVMREGRRYSLQFYSDNDFYYIYRAS